MPIEKLTMVSQPDGACLRRNLLRAPGLRVDNRDQPDTVH